MHWRNLTFAVSFTVVGAILLMFRVLYMCCQGKPWNNPPTVFGWRYAICIGGATILVTALASPGYDCSQSSCSKNYDYLNILIAFGIGMLLAPLVWYCLGKAVDKAPSEDEPEPPPPQYMFNVATGEDFRGFLAGYDILFLLMGIGIFLVDASLAVCNCP